MKGGVCADAPAAVTLDEVRKPRSNATARPYGVAEWAAGDGRLRVLKHKLRCLTFVQRVRVATLMFLAALVMAFPSSGSADPGSERVADAKKKPASNKSPAKKKKRKRRARAACVRGRTVEVRLRLRRRERLRRGRIYVGRRSVGMFRRRGVRVRRGFAVRVRVRRGVVRVRLRLRRVPRGRFRVTVRVLTRRGRRLRKVRVFRQCFRPGLLAVPGCVDDTGNRGGIHPGGEWRTYGQDLKNTRSQPAERKIDASNASRLHPSFVFNAEERDAGTVHSSPVVADGCVFFGTAAAPPRGAPSGSDAALSGWVFALNADTGRPLWQTKLSVGRPGLLCSGVVGSTPVVDGRVYAIVSQSGSPYAVALDERTGKVLWRTVLDQTPQVYNCGGPVVYDGMVIAPFTGDQTGPANRGGYTLLDARTGAVLAKSYTIPDRDYAAGYKGGGIWTNAAVDRDTGYAYFGTANPDAGTPEHERTNSIIKVDVNRKRAAFGQIVASYKGNPDRYAEGLPNAPFPCDPDHRLSPYIRSVMCAQMDLDFGSSPNLIEGPSGQRWVSAMQKSGVFHVADAASMKRVWTAVLSPPVFYGNGSTAATDGSSMYVAASPDGQLFALNRATGAYRWAEPIGDVIHYQAVTYANGLVYTNDAKGFLNVFRADNGAPVAVRSIGGDIGKANYAEESSGSTTLARNTVYVAASNFVVAYRVR